MLNHKHIIVKAYVINPPTAGNEKAVEDWMRRLIQNVNMNIIAGPFVFYADQPGNEGITGAVVIQTSHASFHCWDKVDHPYIQFDLYSCSDFNSEIVLNMFNEFDVICYDWMVIDRNNDPKIIEQGKKNVL